jgi:signal transduction histidine kinase
MIFVRSALKTPYWVCVSVFFLCISADASGQENRLLVEPIGLAEEATEQEGLFYMPQLQQAALDNPGRTALEKILQTSTKSSNKIPFANAAIQLAWMEFIDGNTQKSIQLTQTALELVSESENKSNLPLAELLIAWFKLKNGSYSESLLLANKIAADSRNSKLHQIKGASLSIAAQSQLASKDWQNAQRTYLAASKSFSAAGLRQMEARCLVQSAESALRKGDYAASENILKSAYNIFSAIKDASGMALVLRDQGIIFFKKGLYSQATEEFQKSLLVQSQLSTAKLLKDSYLKLSTLNTLSGNHKSADETKIRYEQLRDSIDGVESSRVLNSRSTRRDLMERAAINEMLKKDINFTMEGVSANDLERNRLLIDAEIERLEKEKLIEELNVEKRKTDITNQERDERIKELLREKQSQELALSKKELQVSQGKAFRDLLIAVSISIIIISLLLYNRYRNEKRSRQDLDRTFNELSETHSKLVATQEQLVHSQKMASLGQLTAGIAHEIQNPLNFVNNFSELSIELIEEMKTASDVEKEAIMNDIISNLRKINEHGKRADRIVKGMLTHSRVGKPEKQPVDLNKMIEELLELSYHGNRSRDQGFKAEILKNLDPQIPKVNVVMQEISRVLVNIFNNAFYAVHQRFKCGDKSYTASVGVSTLLDGNQVIIKIRDNGTGMPEEVQKRIFDPFFTTKPSGEGTGLGLSLSYDIIVKAHQGSLKVFSEPGSFTEFTITLPLA